MQECIHATIAQVPWQSICKAHSASWGPCRGRTDRPRRLDRCQTDRTCMAHATCLRRHVRYARAEELDWPYSLLWEDCGHRRSLRPNLAGGSPSTCSERTRRCWSACEACFLRRSWPGCQPGQVGGGVWRGAVLAGGGTGGGGSERRGRNGVERGMGGANANNAAACRIEKPSHCRPLVDCFLLCLASLVLGQACEIMYLHVARVRQRSTM